MLPLQVGLTVLSRVATAVGPEAFLRGQATECGMVRGGCSGMYCVTDVCVVSHV